MDDKAALKDIFFASLKAVDPYLSVMARRDSLLKTFREGGYKKLSVAGFGKAACPMAKAIEDVIPVDGGMVITKYGHCNEKYQPEKVQVYEAGHPVPDENGLRAAGRLTDLARGLDEDTMVVCLVSGGGSALLTAPCEGITLDEKRTVTGLLLNVGADINELNTVRKHISGVKGGRLAQMFFPAKVVSLLLSDVVGDKVDVIASGPTAPDSSTFHDALNVLKKYNLLKQVPESVLKVIEKGADGQLPETPKAGDSIFDTIENIIVGSNLRAIEAAKERAEALGFRAEILFSELTGEAREAGRLLSEKAMETRRDRSGSQRVCLISGGETTVTVRGRGKGGRNTELALAFALAIDGRKGITLLSAGTDGNDGPTDAAGAVVDGDSVQKARRLGMDAGEYIDDNDSYTFFKKTGDILITGPTGTNVMDVQIIAVE